MVTPKIVLSFINFTALDDSDSDPIILLKKITNDGNETQLRQMFPSISYRCTFCNEEYSSDVDIMEHLKTVHTMELPVMCFQCEKQFTITTLTQYRWRHKCIDQTKLNNTNCTKKPWIL